MSTRSMARYGAMSVIDANRCEPGDIPEDRRAAWSSRSIHRAPRGATISAPMKSASSSPRAALMATLMFSTIFPAARRRRSGAGGRSIAFHKYRADCIVAESNFGGEMVRATIQAADRNVPVRLVTASRGKAVRAEPISVRYAQGQVHHAGRFGKLEDQLCAFSGAGYNGGGSPDHADAAIWALTHLFGRDDGTGIIEFYRREAEGGAGG